MAAKSDKENTPKKSASQKIPGPKKSSLSPKKLTEEDESLGLDNDETETKAGKKLSSAKTREDDFDSDDDTSEIEEDDDSTTRKKGEGDDDWDPDFNEFDLPKSSKKTSVKKGGKESEDDDYKIDDEFKDLFGSKSSSRKYNEDDDY